MPTRIPSNRSAIQIHSSLIQGKPNLMMRIAGTYKSCRRAAQLLCAGLTVVANAPDLC